MNNGKNLLWDGNSTFYRIESDSIQFVTKIKDSDFSSYPKPKISNDFVWISNGKKILKKSLNVEAGNKKTPGTILVFPPEIQSFAEFEVIDEENLILWGVSWQKKTNDSYVPDNTVKSFAIIFNITTNNISKSIKDLDQREITNFYEAIQKSKIITAKSKQYIMFVEYYSGLAHIYNSERKTLKTIDLLRKEELPANGGAESVNNGPAIGWISPVGDEEMLIACRIFVRGKGKTEAEAVWIDTFKTLDLSNNTLSQDLMNFNGFTPNINKPLILFRGGVTTLENVVAIAQRPN